MIWTLILVLGLVALSFLGLVREGGRLLGRSWEPVELLEKWPQATVIVPADGFHPAARACLTSLLDQDYPAFEVIFVTATQDAQAAPLIREIIKTRVRAKHVVSGPATRCGQKNHNLLAGIEAADPETGVLVFCDAGRMAPQHFLKALVAPVALGITRVSSGYHHLAPQKETLSQVGRAVTVLVLYLTRSFGWLIQPWGGATAIGRTTFNELKIRDIWAENIVDDVSLSALMNRCGLPTHAAPGATLITPLAEPIAENWTEWLTRQLLFLKFCQPAAFLAAGVYIILLTTAIISAGVLSAASLCGLMPPWCGLPGGLFLLYFFWVGNKIRHFHPQTFHPVVWMAAFSSLTWIACRAFWAAVLSSELSWMKKRYRIGPGGRIISIL